MPTRCPRRPGLPAALMVLALAATARAADEVVLIPDSALKLPGGRVRGQITSETPTTLTIQPAAGAAQQVPNDQIAEITYEGQPASLALAQTRLDAGQFDEAIDLFAKAASESGGKPLIATAAQYGRARALAGLALSSPDRIDEAIGQLDAFVRANPRARQLGPALESLVRLALQKGDTARADQALGSLTGIAPFADRAAVLGARVLARKGQHDQAIKALDAIIASAPKESARSVEARLARAESLAALKQFAPAEAAVREVIREAPPEDADIQAKAHNTLGDCLRASGQPKAALIAFLKTDILYGEDKEQHPRALAAISELWRELKRDDRADETLERLRQQYPRSPWASAPGGGSR